MKKQISIAVFLGLLICPVIAGKLSLNEAVNTARKSNPEIQAAKSRWDAARSAVLKSYSLPDPEIGADFEKIPSGSSDLRLAEMRFYKISQTIPWPGMILAEGGAAAARAEMAKYAYASKEKEVTRRVKTAYFDLSKTDKMIEIVAANVGVMQQAYRVAQANYSAGTASQVEALKMQIELNRLQNELESLRDERAEKNLQLGLLLNNSTEETLAVDPLPGRYLTDLNYEQTVASALQSSPVLKQEEKLLEESRARVGSARSNYFPETMIKWKSQKVGPTPGANDLMFDFSLPLWFLTNQNPQLKEAGSNLAAQEESVLAAKNLVRQEVKDRFTRLKIFRRKLKLYDSSLLASARSVLEGSLAQYKGGKIEFMTMVDSLRTHLEINQEYYEALASYHASLAELEEVVGIEFKEELK